MNEKSQRDPNWESVAQDRSEWTSTVQKTLSSVTSEKDLDRDELTR